MRVCTYIVSRVCCVSVGSVPSRVIFGDKGVRVCKWDIHGRASVQGAMPVGATDVWELGSCRLTHETCVGFFLDLELKDIISV